MLELVTLFLGVYIGAYTAQTYVQFVPHVPSPGEVIESVKRWWLGGDCQDPGHRYYKPSGGGIDPQ